MDEVVPPAMGIWRPGLWRWWRRGRSDFGDLDTWSIDPVSFRPGDGVRGRFACAVGALALHCTKRCRGRRQGRRAL